MSDCIGLSHLNSEFLGFSDMSSEKPGISEFRNARFFRIQENLVFRYWENIIF